MRPSFLWTSVGCLACSVTLQAAEPGANACDALLGVWEYVKPSPPGRAILAKRGETYAGVALQTWREEAGTREPTTDAEKADAYSTLNAVAYEFSCEGSSGRFRWKARNLFAARPNEVGIEWAIDIESDGDTARWWFIGPDGQRSALSGASRRLK